MSIRVSIRAHPRFLVVTDVFSLLVVELLLLGVSRVRVLLSPLATVILGVVAAAAFAADVAVWYWTGARSVEVTDDALTIFRGPSLSAWTCRRTDVERLAVRRFLGVGSVRLRTRSRRRLRISENAFPREEFRRFLTVMETWER